MAIFSFSNLKGGVGKSSTCVHFTYWLSQILKQKTAVIDADAAQSTSKWLGVLGLDIPVECVTDPDQLAERIPQLAKDYSHVVVDNAGNSSEATRMTVMNSDLVVIPITPTGLDMATTVGAVRLVKQMQRNGKPQAGVFLNRAVRNTKLLKEAQMLLENLPHLVAFRTVIYQRQQIADAYLQQQTVWGLKETDARSNYEQLFQEILKVVEV